jgi:hypothetical protein
MKIARETSMTPDERQLITGLFDRMRAFGPVEKDRDAEALINQTVRQMPDAPYMLVQSVLVQEQALQQADQRIRELEEKVQRLEAQTAQARAAPASGGILGGLFGGPKRPAEPQPMGGGSVPITGRPSSGFGGQPMGAPAPTPWSQPAAGQPTAGGGFLKSAMATAAGVAGGMLLADSIRGMMGGAAAKDAPQTASSGEAAAADEPVLQDAQNQGSDTYDPGEYDPNLQDADYESDGGDWLGGGDEFEV